MTETAKNRGLVGCRRCARVWPIETNACARCGSTLKSRSRNSMFQVWFWWSLGVAAYVPANVWPMLETRILFKNSDDAIITGAIKLMQHGAVPIAIVILVASVVIPIGKFAAIAYLALSVQRRNAMSAHWRHKIYEAIEFIGRWSMIDVFVVAVLSSLVQFAFVATVKPGLAALAFALSVIFTMLSALSFDSRIIWDLDEPEPAKTTR